MNIAQLISLWNHTQKHPGTSGARACAGVLLGMYNGTRFPFDLTELRLLDKPLREAALAVIADDATRCQHEVHDWLNMISRRKDFGARFEWLATDYKCFKRKACTVKELTEQYGGRPMGLLVTQVHPSGWDVPQTGPVKVSADRIETRDPSGTIVGVKKIGPSLNLSYDQITEQGLRLTPEQAAAVKAMTDNFDADAHQRALNTPFFNDLAG